MASTHETHGSVRKQQQVCLTRAIACKTMVTGVNYAIIFS